MNIKIIYPVSKHYIHSASVLMKNELDGEECEFSWTMPKNRVPIVGELFICLGGGRFFIVFLIIGSKIQILGKKK